MFLFILSFLIGGFAKVILAQHIATKEKVGLTV